MRYVQLGAPFQLVAILTFIIRRLLYPPEKYPILALVLLVTGLSLFVYCLHVLYLRKNAKQQLITTGPFRFTRHPMYLAFILMDLTAFLRPITPGLVSSGFIFLATLAVAAYWQEKETLARFGSAAESYYQKTPRFLFTPRFGRSAKFETSSRAK